MNNSVESSNAAEKKAKTQRTLRIVWMVLIVVFIGIIGLRLFEWSQGKDNLRGILAPIGMIFVGAGAILRPRNQMLANILTLVAIVLVFTSLILMFIY